MSTQTDGRVDSIEHLNYTPECCSDFHSGDRSPATHITDQHGCDGGPVCTKCLAAGRERFNHIVALVGFAQCNRCGTEFTQFEDCVQVMPL